MKNGVMDIVISDILARFGMILSRSLGFKIWGFIKLDLKYATILVFGVEEHWLYKESIVVKTITKID